jgi:hypothetical protein
MRGEESVFMRPLKRKMSVTLDGDIIEIIKELAEKDGRSFSQYINLILKKHIENWDELRQEG